MIEPRRWVIDTNVLVSRLLAPNGVAARAVDRALTCGVLLVSDATLGELVEVLSRPKFDPYLGVEQRRQFIGLLGGVSYLIPITRQFQACRDPRDDKFLDVALNGEAEAIVTGDADLLALNPFHGVRILAPAIFLDHASKDNPA
jgi:putative PIN family toxin of toxin-antitoxin system